jgi:hypothetical protein
LEGQKLRLDESESTILTSEADGKKYESLCVSKNNSTSGSIAAVVPDESGSLQLGELI